MCPHRPVVSTDDYLRATGSFGRQLQDPDGTWDIRHIHHLFEDTSIEDSAPAGEIPQISTLGFIKETEFEADDDPTITSDEDDESEQFWFEEADDDPTIASDEDDEGEQVWFEEDSKVTPPGPTRTLPASGTQPVSPVASDGAESEASFVAPEVIPSTEATDIETSPYAEQIPTVRRCRHTRFVRRVMACVSIAKAEQWNREHGIDQEASTEWRASSSEEESRGAPMAQNTLQADQRAADDQ
ncbi:hypothetical protein MMC19_002914 [Ptychographa xylographoides]|nr:hypothetical protein [Ptychographa xylographoides]